MRKIRIARKRNPGCWGLAFPGEWRIELDDRLHDKTLLDIATHEVAHVVIPDLDESAVDRLGKHVADVLWRLGFRREDDGA
jgi:hypothetical protein